MNNLDDRVVQAMKEIGFRLRLRFDSSQMSVRKAVALEVLSNPPPSVDALAEEIRKVGGPNAKASTSAIATDLKELHVNGYIERKFSNKDGRQHYYALTERGKRMVEAVREKRQKMYGPLIRLLGTNSKKEEFYNLLTTFTKELDKENLTIGNDQV